MLDGKEFNGAKAYKDAKLCNMMTVLELHRRYHVSTGVAFTSMYPGCIAETALFRQKRGWFRWRACPAPPAARRNDTRARRPAPCAPARLRRALRARAWLT